jgi:hypothetical protein
LGAIEIAIYDGLTNAREYGLQSIKPWVEVEVADYEDEVIIEICKITDPDDSLTLLKAYERIF